MDERQVRRLIVWNQFWLMLFLAGALVWGGRWMLEQARTSSQRLNVRWRDGGLKFSSASDGPFLVTHLVRLPGRDHEKAIARLPVPLAIIDSGGGVITRDEYRRLVWKDYLGGPVPAPAEGSPVHALYSRPLYSELARSGP